MTQTFLSPAQVDELVALYEAGATLVDLGEQFGVSQQTVRRAVAAEGVRIRPPGRALARK